MSDPSVTINLTFNTAANAEAFEQWVAGKNLNATVNRTGAVVNLVFATANDATAFESELINGGFREFINDTGSEGAEAEMVSPNHLAGITLTGAD